jgi:hypothetical protein
MLVIG